MPAQRHVGQREHRRRRDLQEDDAARHHRLVRDRVQHEDHEEDQRDVRDVAALDLVVDGGEDAHDAAGHHELDAARPGAGGLVARDRARPPSGPATISWLVLTATARMPNSSLSHQASTLDSPQLGESVRPGEELALLDRVALVLVVGDGAVAELAEPGRAARPSATWIGEVVVARRPPCGSARGACGRASGASARACSTRGRSATRFEDHGSSGAALSMSRRTITSPMRVLLDEVVRGVHHLGDRLALVVGVEEGDVGVAAVVGHERPQEARRAVRAQLEDHGAHGARMQWHELPLRDRRSGSCASSRG